MNMNRTIPRWLRLPLAALILSGCSDSTEPTAPPVLSVPIVDLTTVETFIPFGAPLPGSGVLNPAYELVVAVGQTITPGTVLGRVGLWSADHGRVELQINRGNASIYPRDLGTPGFNAAHEAAFAGLDRDPSWTSVCLAETVVP